MRTALPGRSTARLITARPWHRSVLAGCRCLRSAACGVHPPAALPLPAAGRYSRYREVSGRGRFKTVFKGFDEKQVGCGCCRC